MTWIDDEPEREQEPDPGPPPDFDKPEYNETERPEAEEDPPDFGKPEPYDDPPDFSKGEYGVQGVPDFSKGMAYGPSPRRFSGWLGDLFGGRSGKGPF